jgi:menaquinone-dependent protoporphyrinogen IX oxidase
LSYIHPNFDINNHLTIKTKTMNKREFLKISLLGAGALAISNQLSALEFYPTTTNKKWAVLFGTWCGTARDASVWISEGMDGIASVFDVRENPDLSPFEHLVIGGAIRGGKVPQELQEYLKKNQEAIKNKVRGLFAVCGNRMKPPGPEQTTNLIDNHLAPLCGVKNIQSKIFLGRITYGLMEEEARKVIKSMNMPEYDNLKRPECLDFGKQLLLSVGK